MNASGKAPARVARRARVRGRVQGVWFRASTADQATRLGLHGHARNLPDGSVEVVAVGSPEAVASLLAWLHEGPPMARVDDVAIEELDPEAAPPAGARFVTG